MWFACAVASAGTVYKWVDENGITHYSDQPHQNAAKVDVQEQPLTGSVAPRAVPSGRQNAPSKDAAPYTSCGIASPTPEEVLFNTFTVNARLNVLPQQRANDQVVITLDGKPVPGLPTTGSHFTLTQLDRGTHSLQASITDETGKTVCQSSSVTFYVRQPSRAAPNAANRPKS
jgi:hypothetical protein